MTGRVGCIRVIFFISCLSLGSIGAFSAVSLSLTPDTASLRPGESQVFNAAVSGTADLRVTWYVNGIAGGNGVLGLVSTSGKYTAPLVAPAAPVTVKAVSVADPTMSDSSIVSFLNPIPLFTDVQPRSLNTGLATTIRAYGSKFVSGAKIYWGAVALPTTFVSATELRALVTPIEIAPYTVSLRVRNPDPGAVDSASAQIVSILPPIFVNIVPPTATFRLGDVFQFPSYIGAAQDPTLKWYVNGILGGNALVGTISTAGLYTTPAVLPAPNVVEVKAASVQDPRAFGTSTVTLLNRIPAFTDVQPRLVNTGLATTIRAYGSGFLSGAQIYWGSVPLTTTFVSSTELRATNTPLEAAGTTVSLRVRNPNSGGVDSDWQGVIVIGPVLVTVDPPAATLRLDTPFQFHSSVDNAQNQTLTWTVNSIAGGNTTIGTISTQGLYTPPALLPAPNVVQLKAASVQDPRAFATSTVTLLNPIPAFTDLQPRLVNTGLVTTIRAYGSGFLSGAQIYWGSIPLTTTFVSSTELRATQTPMETAGTTVQVRIRNPNSGGADSSWQGAIVMDPVAVVVEPQTATLRLGTALQFQSHVYNSEDQTLTWTVNGVAGGNSTIGTISTQGLYSSPALIPTPNVVQIKGASVQDSRAAATSTVTLLNATPVVSGVTPATLTTATTSFIIHGTGFALNATATLDGQPLTLTFVSPVQLNALTSAITPQVGGVALLKVTNPDPGGSMSQTVGLPVTVPSAVMTYAAASRFLEQASWGPAPTSVAHLLEIGRNAWLTEQFSAPASTYVDNIGNMPALASLQSQFMRNAVQGTDQLRQRVAFALSQLFVVSGFKLASHQQMAPYQQLLLTYAFGNFRDLMREVTLSPSMGEYLDMVNNDKPNAGLTVVPNENYARELMQLFTLGPDAYTETDVKQLARALTGWTYPPSFGVPSAWPNPSFYTGQMVAFEEHHDTTAKTILGSSIPAGRSARQDLDAALDIVFNHPNLPRFVSYRLIQRLVTGNPSPSYVGRIAAVFANNGLGVRGDLRAVVRAILLDSEAATDGVSVLAADQGHLREPVLYLTTLLRGLGAVVPENTLVADFAEMMGQSLFYPPSVFNYFSPSYPIPGFGIPGPEFQILNASTVLARANITLLATHGFLTAYASMPLDRFDELAWNVPALLDAISNAMFRGEMQPDMRASISSAIAGFSDPFQRARTALYLAAAHARYQAQR